jgi:tetratricopeptide (TPR) repeat protein
VVKSFRNSIASGFVAITRCETTYTFRSIAMPDTPRGLFRSFVTLLAILALFGCGGREARIAKHFQRAQEHLQQQDYAKARVELRNVLQIEPRFDQAYFLGGQIAERESDWNAAYVNYEKAVEVNPQNGSAQLHLARIYLLFGELDKAEKTLRSSATHSTDDAELRTVNAAIRAARGQYAEAVREARTVLQSAPGREDTISLLAGVYKKMESLKDAEEVLIAGARDNPNSIGLRLDLSSLFLQTNRYEQAEKPLVEISKLAPNAEEHRMRLAAYYSNGGRLDQAESILRGSIAADPRDERRFLALVNFLTEKRDPAKAETELVKFLEKNDAAIDVRLALAELYLGTNRIDKAEAVFREAMDKARRDGDQAKVRNRVAEFFSTRGRLAEAQTLVDELLKKNARDEAALLTRGRIALTKRDPVSAIADFRSLLRSDPNSAEYLSLLARAHLMNNEAPLAREALAQAVERHPSDARVRLLWIDFLATSGDYQRALTEADTALEIAPLDADLLQLKASVQAMTKNPQAAEQTMARLKTIEGGKSSGYHQMGAFYLANQKYEAAIVEFEAALKTAPSSFDSIAGLVKAYLGLGASERALTRIREHYKNQPNQAELAYLTGEILAAQNRPSEAEASLRSSISAKPTWASPYLALRKILTDRRNFKAAEESLRQGLQFLPNDPLLMFSLARVLESAGDYQAAIDAYERLLKSNPSMDIAANNLALLLADKIGDAKNIERGLAIAARFEGSTNGIFLDTLGWLYVKSGQAAKGKETLERALILVSGQPEFNYHLAVAKLQLGDRPAARESLRQALASNLDFAERKDAKALLDETAGAKQSRP